MEGGAAGAVSTENPPAAEGASSYTYWVRGKTGDAAPLPMPRKLTSDDICKQGSSSHLGSAWNQAGTWEEKNLNKWASDRIKELLPSIQVEFSGGKAEISEVTKCSGDAFLVTVRNKKRVGYTYEVTLRVKGEWLIGSENKTVKGTIEVEEFSFGELDELRIQVSLSEEKDLARDDKQRITNDLKRLLQPLQEKLTQFEQELKER